jgi:hypothetical protein
LLTLQNYNLQFLPRHVKKHKPQKKAASHIFWEAALIINFKT